MLSSKYFNGDMLGMIDKMVNMVLGVSDNVQEKEKINIINKDDLMIDVNIYNTVISEKPELEKCFLAFVNNSRVTHRKFEDIYEYSYPVVDGEKTELTQIYEIAGYYHRSFFFFRLYHGVDNLCEFLISVLNRYNYDIDIFPSREINKDGQLKILTDLVQAVDVIDKEMINILVIGSSSAGGVSSGIAYGILPYMGRKIRVDLYDPYNYPGHVIVGNVEYTYYDVLYEISKEDSNKYDLLLDDGWEENYSRSWDRHCRYRDFEHYSIKYFLDAPELHEMTINDKLYYQVGQTESREKRVVSRDVKKFSYRMIPELGSCDVCCELKYRLMREYSKEFYDYIMKSHKVHCIDKSIRRPIYHGYRSYRKEKLWFPLWDRGMGRQDIEDTLKDCYCMYYDVIEEYRVCPVSSIVVPRRLIFTNEIFVTDEIYDDINVVLQVRHYDKKEKRGYTSWYSNRNIYHKKPITIKHAEIALFKKFRKKH